MKKVLFVCGENACRSQIAEAFARIHGQGRIAAASAGSTPSGKVNPRAIALMGEIGFNMSGHVSKSLADLPPIYYDYVITMGCQDACPYAPVETRDWGLEDPRGKSIEQVRQIRDQIKTRVIQLVEELT